MELDSQENPGEIKRREWSWTLKRTQEEGVELDSQENPGEIKRREWSWTLKRTQEQGVELDSQENPGEIKRREWSWTLKRTQEQGVELDSQENPGEIKSREVELGSNSRLVCLAAKLFFNSCFSDTVFVTLLRTAVATATSEARKLIVGDKALRQYPKTTTSEEKGEPKRNRTEKEIRKAEFMVVGQACKVVL